MSCSVNDCVSLARCQGLCAMHYARLKRTGRTEKTTRSDRFWQKVEKTDSCWLWRAAVRADGYGAFGWKGDDGRSTVNIMAHRFAYLAMRGEIPEGLELDHLCRVRSCVNPAHLEPVTSRVNTLRGETITAANARKTKCPKGHEYSKVRSDGRRECGICRMDQCRERRMRLRMGATKPLQQ